MQHRQGANNLPALKTWQNSSIGLWHHSQLSRSYVSNLSQNVTTSTDQFWQNSFSSAITNEAKQTLSNLLANLLPREKYYEEHSASGEGYKWHLLLGGKIWVCGADTDREKYYRCGCGVDSGHKFSVHTISSSKVQNFLWILVVRRNFY